MRYLVSMPDDFSWEGRPAPKRAGGFVTSIGLNNGPPPLAVDPNKSAVASVRERHGGAAGPQLEVEVLGDKPDRQRAPSGRIRLKNG
jgi:hypothetical protein